MQSFGDGVLRLVFPEDLSIYAKLAGDPKRISSLQEILEERLGSRPHLELGVAGVQGTVVTAVPSVNAPAPRAPEPEPARVPHRAPEPPPEPEAPTSEPPLVENPPPDLPEPPEVYGTDGSSLSGSSVVNGGGRVGPEAEPRTAGGDGEIRDGSEVFEMAREFFGPGGMLGGQNGAK